MGNGLGLPECCEACWSDNVPDLATYLTATYQVTIAGLVGGCAIANGVWTLTYFSGGPPPAIIRYNKILDPNWQIRLNFQMSCPPASGHCASGFVIYDDLTTFQKFTRWNCDDCGWIGDDSDPSSVGFPCTTPASAGATFSVLRLT